MSFMLSASPNLRTSPYYDATLCAGVRGFSVYNHMLIPSHFGDPDAEYQRLIDGVAQWDVAAQRQVELTGTDAEALLQYLTPRSLKKLKAGQGRYVPLCNHQGHVINDPVLLKLDDQRFWLSIADSDIGLWAEGIARERGLDVTIAEADASPLAIQGPKAEAVAVALFGDEVKALGYFAFFQTTLDGIPLLVARSGWSKQGGFELYLMDSSRGTELWERVAEAGLAFGIGPGAPNDVERLESGLASYGADFRHNTLPATPFELGMDRLVNLEAGHDFIGREALLQQAKSGITRRWSGLLLDKIPLEPNVQALPLNYRGNPVGYLSEMAYSPRLARMIGVGMIPHDLPSDALLELQYLGKLHTLTTTALPFI